MSRAFDTDFFAPPRPRIFGHRGAAGEFPENTMVSFERAVRAGAIYLELDIHMSREPRKKAVAELRTASLNRWFKYSYAEVTRNR